MHKALLISLLSYCLHSSCFASSGNHKLITTKPSTLCTLNIDRVLVGDCEYGNRTGNQSKVIVAVFLSWTDPVPGEKIQVRLNGMTKIHDPFLKGCPPFVQFILDPDGANYTVDAEFITGNCMAIPVNITLPSPCDPPVCLGPQAIGGKVFSDFNNNGIQEVSENGLTDIEVRLYDDLKQLHAVTTTKTNGLWSVNNLVAGQKLRVEYQIPPGLFDANPGPENKTRTQMASVGNCKVDLAIYQLIDLIDPNPWIVSTCFAKGDASKPGNPAYNEPTLVANRYTTTEGGPRSGPNGNYYVASAGETGSVWGLCYQKETRQLFSGAFLKRNASLGPHGLGAIYMTDLNGFLPNPPTVPAYRYYGRTNLLLNLDSFGIQTGDESVLIRNLPLSPLDASHDSIAFDKIGKWGLGDLDINDTGDTLFTVNLYNRSLIVIAIGNPLQLPITADRIQEIPIPDPGCKSADDWRPWGLKYKDGILYVGGVCSAESTNAEDDLKAVVYAYANGNFIETISFDLNYRKGYLEGNNCPRFRPWNRDFYYYFIGRDIVCGPVPILSDIEFDSEGNMIVSLGDRYGYQTGGREYGTNTRDGLRYISFSGGDNLKLFKLKNEYLLEKNANSGFYTTAGLNNNQGVCGGEFYFQDGFYSHQESVLGALAIHPSYNTVLATLMDPAAIWSNGWSQLSNSTGTKIVNYNIFTGEYGTFGKSAGLGDIELLIASSTPKGIGVSLGNYIWNDRDQDGIQDPGELALSNVPVLLYNQNDSLIRQTVSDTNGLYIFLNLDPYTEYFIQIGADSNYLNNKLLLNNTGYITTTFRSRVNFGNSENDSDASTLLSLPIKYKDKIALNYFTGKDGENNFSLDFGLVSCSLVIADTLNLNLCLNDSIKVGDIWFSANHTSGLVSFPNTLGFGCDSLVMVNANIHLQSTERLDTFLCDGENMILHNVVFDNSQPTASILLARANQNSCDSILDVSVNFLPISKMNLDTSICPGGFINLHNQRFDEFNLSGNIVLLKSNQYGCDSTIEVNLQVLPVSNTRLDTSICSGVFILLHNQRFDESRLNGNIVLKAANQFACDSTIDVHVRVRPKSSSTIDTFICPGEFVLIHGNRFDELNRNGQIVLSSANSFVCDSTIQVNLKVHPASMFQLDTSVCPGGNVVIHNQVFDENKTSGSFVFSGANQFACDSTLLVNLRIRPSYQFADSIDACVEYTWPVNGRKYFDSGNFRYNALTSEGCDSSYQMQLRIHPEYQFNDTICVINKFNWPVNNREYQQSGIYPFNHRSSFGCDSIEYLYLTVVQVGEVYIPNAFTPNGDQINDRVYVHANEDVHLIDVFAIYNRWGEMVFEQRNFLPNDPQFGWNGIFNGEPANPAVFVWWVEFRDKLGGKHSTKGDVTLIR